MSRPLYILSALDVWDVSSQLDVNVVLDSVFEGLRAISATSIPDGTVVMPHRTKVESAKHTTLFMPSRLKERTIIKVVSIPKSSGSEEGLPATTLVMDERSGGVDVVVNARSLTALRTAAGSAIATKLVLDGGKTRPSHLVLFGAGAQIHAHAGLLIASFPSIKHCTVINRSHNNRLITLLGHFRVQFPNVDIIGLSGFQSNDIAKAVQQADIIVTATSSTVPLFPSNWIKSGAHINLIGSFTPSMKEVDDQLISRARIVLVDSRSACAQEAGELISAKFDMNSKKCVEIGECDGVSVELMGDNVEGDVTLFKSVGVSVMDAAITNLVVNAARERGRGNLKYSGQLAAAYYDPIKCILYILEDTTDYWGHFDLAKMVIDQISPTLIITSSKSDVKFIQGILDTHPGTPPKFLIRPKREFNYTTALERLLSLDLLVRPGATREDRLQQHFQWAARVRLNSFSNTQICSGGIAAAGALMEFMSAQKGIHVQTDYELEKVPDVNLEEWNFEGIGSIHSSISKLSSGSGGVKDWSMVKKFIENVSCLYDSFIGLGFESGTGVDKQIDEVEVVQKIDWQSSNDANRLIVQPHVDDELDDWKMMLGGLDSLLASRTNFFQSKVAVQIASEMPSGYTDSINVVYFPQLGFLTAIPLRDEWQNEDGLQVPEPPDMGCGNEFVYQFCTEQSAFFKSSKMHDLDEHIGDLHPAIVDREIEIIHTLEQRILIHKEMILAIVDVCAELDCHSLLAFAEVSKLYNYVCPEIVEESLLDIREGRHPLQEQIVNIFVANDVHIVAGEGMAANIDQNDGYDENSNLGDFGYEMNVDGEEGKTDEGKQNSSSGMRKERSIVICTGANACGKSVYLKQTALIVFMAQVISFPSKCREIEYYDSNRLGVFGRIQTRESVSKAQSAFMLDLNQVSLALRNITPRSLLIIDEFGKGTLAADGAGLFCGLVKYLLELGAQCPRTLIATHFHEVFRDDEALISPLSLPISFVHMQILLTTVDGNPIKVGNEESPEDESYGNAGVVLQQGDGITYLYKATPGLCLSSYAAHCALAFGIPFDVVSRAKKVTDAVARHAIQEIVDDKMTAEEERELENAEAVCRRFLAWDISADMEKDDIDVMGKLKEILGERWEEEYQE
ncbi:hypothetical protein Clacol_009822 [Clathrus columnatus]|uniref:DNA mismatch repair proteins mutS family domain-containing protein n=1 Tax=Clathrus columnatus TaxID=1419009 RepID=A0AAV5AQW2_9AGAM|nr:hypothetical protein Clacol_009822 [Clathrus columnatus]